MSKLTENRSIYMCHIILQHYRFIKKMNDMKADEFSDFIYNTSPDLYAAFVNKRVNTVRNIIVDYITIVDKTLKKMKNKSNNAEKCREADMIKLYHHIICLKYTNKTPHSDDYIEKKLGIGKRHLCEYNIAALKTFLNFFNQTACRLNYSDALTNSIVRVVEIARLAEKANQLQKKAQKKA